MTRKPVRALATTVALALSLALGACGSGGSDGSGAAGGGSASSAAGGSDGSSAGEQAAPEAQVGDVVAFADVATRSAAAAVAKKTVHITGTSPVGTLTGDIDYAAKAIAYSAAGGPQGEAKTVFVDNVLYVGVPALKAAAGGKDWIKIDPGGTSPMAQAMKPLLEQVFTMLDNPMKGLQGLTDLKATVTAVDETGTTYELRLTAEQVKQMAETLLSGTPLGSAGVPGATYQPTTMAHTLDADGLPVKVVVSSGEGTPPMTLTYSGWGAPVAITAPPAEQVGTL